METEVALVYAVMAVRNFQSIKFPFHMGFSDFHFHSLELCVL